MIDDDNKNGSGSDDEAQLGLVVEDDEPPCNFCEVHGGHAGWCPVIS